MLAMEIDFCDRQPKPGEELTLGVVDLKNKDNYFAFDTTAAWCWQQGTMLQWLGSASDKTVVYNSVKDRQYISVLRDVKGDNDPAATDLRGNNDGKQAVSLR
jgi:hypothetical protein